jgi:hypothetical protein
MKMLKVHQNAPTSMLKSENFSGVIPPDPRIKRGGEEREELGREGIGVWPTQKLSRGAPYGPPPRREYATACTQCILRDRQGS